MTGKCHHHGHFVSLQTVPICQVMGKDLAPRRHAAALDPVLAKIRGRPSRWGPGALTLKEKPCAKPRCHQALDETHGTQRPV